MSDLYDTLHWLVYDVDTAPLPVEEVRRRGDQLRRRRIAVEAFLATTVVAVVAWVLAYLLFGGGAMDEAEFDVFYAASFRRLVGQVFAMIGNRDEAQECVQEAFVRAWSHRAKIEKALPPRHGSAPRRTALR